MLPHGIAGFKRSGQGRAQGDVACGAPASVPYRGFLAQRRASEAEAWSSKPAAASGHRRRHSRLQSPARGSLVHGPLGGIAPRRAGATCASRGTTTSPSCRGTSTPFRSRRRRCRPRLRVLRAGAPAPAQGGPGRTPTNGEVRRYRHGDRRRPWLRVLSSRQPLRTPRDPMPGRPAGADRRQLADRTSALSAPDGRRLPRRPGVAPYGLRGLQPARAGRGVHEAHLHRDGRGRPRAGARRRTR